MSTAFNHLAVRSHYSLCESTLQAKNIIEFASKHQLKSIGITDTANLFGALDNASQLASAGIQPIIGIRLPVALSKHDSSFSYISLYPPSQKGYQQLLRISSRMHTHPLPLGHAILLDELLQNNEDLIAHTGSSDGIIPQLINNKKITLAENILAKLKNAFPDRLYVAISRHSYLREKHAEPWLLHFAHSLKLPLLAIQDALIPSPKEYKALRILYSIQQKNIHIDNINPDQLSDQLSLKPPATMARLFHDIPEALENTLYFPKRFSFMPSSHKPMMPRFDDSMSPEQESQVLHQLAHQGLLSRKSFILSQNPHSSLQLYSERLEYELSVIARMGYSGYFLIVADFVNWAKEKKISVGPGRGSGAGSLVAWCTGITSFDPIPWNLMFERFLNPDRISLPDFDIDFSQNERNDVIQYVFDKYGHERVAQIITFGSLRARAAVQDVGRATGKSYGEIESLSKLIPQKIKDEQTAPPLADAIKASPELQETIKNDPSIQEWLNLAMSIEGLARHASTHAGGVVISPLPITEILPLYHDERAPFPITQFDMKMVEKSGLVKFDFLGLNTLTIIDNACSLVNQRHNLELSPETLPLDNQKTFQLLSSAETFGIFQVESLGMRDAIKKLKPHNIQEIIALIALYRPGPMDNIPTFINRKHGNEPISYPLPQLQSILEETYGVIVYQEQVIEIAKQLAGFSLAEADLLRRAMGKKDKHAMETMREDFLSKSQTHSDISYNDALGVFNTIHKFSEYAFNKSHSAGYAIICYQTAFFKANYPLEFFTASMNGDIDDKDRLAEYISHLKLYNINVLPPNINASQGLFFIENKDTIRSGLASLKNVSENDIKNIVLVRQQNLFSSLEDFCDRVHPQNLNKRALENIIRAGSFDSLNYNRTSLLNSIDKIIRFNQDRHQEKNAQQANLFADANGSLPPLFPTIPHDTTPPPSLEDICNMEFDAFGFYFSAHPLDAYENILENFRFTNSREINSNHSSFIHLAGKLEKHKTKQSRRQNHYALAILSDRTGKYEVIVPSSLYAKLPFSLKDAQKKLLYILASFEVSDDKTSIFAHSISFLSDHFNQNTQPLLITIDGNQPEQRSQCLQELKIFLQNQSPSQNHRVPVYITIQQNNHAPTSFNTSETIPLSLNTLQQVSAIKGVHALGFKKPPQ